MADTPADPPPEVQSDAPAPVEVASHQRLDPSKYHLYTNIRGNTLYVHKRFDTWLQNLPPPLTPEERYVQGITPTADHPLHPHPALSPRERFSTQFPIDTPLRVSSAPAAIQSSQDVHNVRNPFATGTPGLNTPYSALPPVMTGDSLGSRKRSHDQVFGCPRDPQELQDIEHPRKRNRLHDLKGKVSRRFSLVFSAAGDKADAGNEDSPRPCSSLLARATETATLVETQNTQPSRPNDTTHKTQQSQPNDQTAGTRQTWPGDDTQGVQRTQTKEENKLLNRMSRIFSTATPNSMPSLRASTPVTLPDCIVRIIFMGDASVGKTALIKRFATGQFDQTNTPTGLETGFSSISRGKETIGLEIWEAGGSVESTRTSALNFAWFDVVIICYSVQDSSTVQRLREYYNNTMLRTEGAHIILVGLKKDTRREYGTLRLSFLEEPDAVAYHEGQRWAQECHADDFFECSAATGENVNEMFERAIDLGVQRKKGIQKNAARLDREAKMEKRIDRVGKFAGRLLCFTEQ